MEKEPSVAVITCTIGRGHLDQTLKSIEQQTHKNIQHYIVTDAAMTEAAFAELRAKHEAENRHWVYWPTKVGGPGWECRRLWSMLAPVINEDAVCFLNDDDWYEPVHVEALLTALKHGFDWAHSFRKIYDEQGNYLFDDICESLGEAHPVWNMQWQNFAEQCSVMMTTHCYRAIAPYFALPGFGNDRLTYQMLKRLYPRVAACAEHTMCFRLGGSPYSVSKDYFVQGNAWMRQKYGDNLPWLKK
jgi:glycosyltransferase involved in cell wall biosynthesis